MAKAALAEQLAPLLHFANKNNDTDRVLDLLDQSADPLAEDTKAPPAV